MTTVSQVGTAAVTSNTASLTPSVTGTWGTGQNRTAGHLLVAIVTAYGNNTAFMGDSPAGWMLFDGGHGALANGTDLAFAYFRVAAGTDTAPTFTATMTGTAADCRLDVTLYEYSDSGGGTPVLSTSGMAAGTSGTTLTVTTRLNVVTGSAALSVIVVSQGTTAATAAWTPPSGWTAEPNITASFRAQFAIFSLAAPTAGSTLSAALPHGRVTTTLLAGLILVISPAGSASPVYTDSLVSKSQASVTAATGVTWTHVSNGTGALVVGVSCGDPAVTGAATISTITCDGTALSALTASEQPGTAPGDNGGFVRQYGLANVSAGSHTIVVKPNSTVDLTLSSRVIAGADPTSPFGTGAVAQGTGATASTTKTGTAGNLILYATCSGTAIGGGPNGTAYRTYGKSLNGSSGGGNGDHGAAVATGSSQTISTLIGSDDWAISVVEILPASAAPSPGVATLAGTGSVGTAEVQGSSATLAGTGSLATAGTEKAPATLAGTASLAAAAAQNAGTTLGAAGSLTAAAVQGTTGTVLGGAGSVTGSGTVPAAGAATLSAAGSLAAAAVQQAAATLAGAGSLTAPGTQRTSAALAGTGAIGTPGAVQGASAVLGAAGSVATAGTSAGAGTLGGQGSVSSGPALAAPAVLGGAGSLAAAAAQGTAGTVLGAQGAVGTPAVTQGTTGTVLGGQGSVGTPAVTQGAAGTVLGAHGSLSAAGIQGSSAALAGAGSLAAPGSQLAGAVLAAAGSLAAAAVQGAPTTLGGAGSLSAPSVIAVITALGAAGSLSASAGGGASGAATLGGAGSLNPPATQGSSAALAGTASVGTPAVVLGASAALAGTGSVASLATRQASAALAAAGSLTSLAVIRPAAAMTAAGALAASASQLAVTSLAGAASLAASAGGSAAGAATLAAAGSLAALPVQRVTSALLAGAGLLSSLAVQRIAGTVLAGAGSLAATHTIRVVDITVAIGPTSSRAQATARGTASRAQAAATRATASRAQAAATRATASRAQAGAGTTASRAQAAATRATASRAQAAGAGRTQGDGKTTGPTISNRSR